MALEKKQLRISGWGTATLYPVASWADGLEMYRSIDDHSRIYNQPHFIFLMGDEVRSDAFVIERLERDQVVFSLPSHPPLHGHRKWLANFTGTYFTEGRTRTGPEVPEVIVHKATMSDLLGLRHSLLRPDEEFAMAQAMLSRGERGR